MTPSFVFFLINKPSTFSPYSNSSAMPINLKVDVFVGNRIRSTTQKSTDPFPPTFDSTPNWVICLGSKSDDDTVYWVDRRVMGELTDTGHNRICSNWEITGQCPYGDSCSFAHGQSELVTPGGRIEAEVLMNTCFISSKAVLLPVHDVAPKDTLLGAPTRGVENKLNWKPPRKIAGIYGDWPDDYILPDNYPNTMDCC